jgi:predicted metalloprotease with PDZ domain
MAPATLIVPRTYPGGYTQVPYDSFVENVRAVSQSGQTAKCIKEAHGPRWKIGEKGDDIVSIEYQVDLPKMEKELRSSVDSSKVRPGYVGLLGYSIFGYVDGLETSPIALKISAPAGWPVFATLNPNGTDLRSNGSAQAADYYALADSEVFLGPDFKLRKFDGKVSLVMVVHAEGEEDLDADGKLAREALDRVQEYFGDTPFSAYTVQLEILPPSPGHECNFGQEHTDSGTFCLSTDKAITTNTSLKDRRNTLFFYAHHMAHSWIPKRAYGVGYRPIMWELAPISDTVWFNEGFGRYAALEALVDGMAEADGRAARSRQLTFLHSILDSAPPFIRDMPLVTLSREASVLYTVDFRTGMNTFARGALMAAEMDDRIRSETKGKKSLREGLRALLAWSNQNQKPFQIQEISALILSGTGVNVSDIQEHWMAPQP